ncbi:12168_t:CDS:1, partial [Racocetra persica]
MNKPAILTIDKPNNLNNQDIIEDKLTCQLDIDSEKYDNNVLDNANNEIKISSEDISINI